VISLSGKSIRKIARITGHSRNTVRKYLRANGIPEPRYPKKRGSKLDLFKPSLEVDGTRDIQL